MRQIGLGPTLWPYLNLISSLKALSLNIVTFRGTRIGELDIFKIAILYIIYTAIDLYDFGGRRYNSVHNSKHLM